MSLIIRKAMPTDVSIAAPLMYLAGPAFFDFIYNTESITSLDFIHFAFKKEMGFSGCPIHFVAELKGEVVGIGADYNANNYEKLCRDDEQVTRELYNATDAEVVLKRGSHMESVMASPTDGMYYFANFAVSPNHRRQGIGQAIVEYAINDAKQRHFHTFALDVSSKNNTAIALYEKCGLQIEKRNAFSAPDTDLPDGYRMTLNLVCTQ